MALVGRNRQEAADAADRMAPTGFATFFPAYCLPGDNVRLVDGSGAYLISKIAITIAAKPSATRKSRLSSSRKSQPRIYFVGSTPIRSSTLFIRR